MPYKMTSFVMTGPQVVYDGVVFGKSLFAAQGNTNLVSEPAFEDGSPLSVWTSVGGGVLALDPTFTHPLSPENNSLKVTSDGTGSNTGARATFTVTSSTSYRVSAGVYIPYLNAAGTADPTSGAGVHISGDVTGAITDVNLNAHITDGWQMLETTFTTGVSDTSVTIALRNYDRGDAWFDVIQLWATSNQYTSDFTQGSRGIGFTWSGAKDNSNSVRANTSCFIDLTSLNIPTYNTTFMAWARPYWANTNATANLNCMAAIIDNASAGITLRCGRPSGSPAWIVASNGYSVPNNTVVASSPSTTWVGGDLIFVAGTVDSTGKVLGYGQIGVDGSFIGPVNSSVTLSAGLVITRLYIGGHRGAAEYFDGLIDGVLFFNRVLSTSEIQGYANGDNWYNDNDAIIRVDFKYLNGMVWGNKAITPVGGSETITVASETMTARRVKWDKRMNR